MVSKPARLIFGLGDVSVAERRTRLSTGVFLRVDVVELGELGLSTIPVVETVMFDVAGLEV